MPTQKFKRGTKVLIAEDLGPAMSHFSGRGGYAFVQYTYKQRYPHFADEDDHKQYSLYILDSQGKIRNTSSWYNEDQLTKVPSYPREFEKAVANFIH